MSNIHNPYQIVFAAFIETGTTPDMTARNYVTHVTAQTLNDLTAQTNDGAMFTPENLAGLSGQILINDPNGERMVNIANGWGNRRCRFIIRVGLPHDNTISYLYTGYTNYNGWDRGAKDFDPNMELFFNSVVQLTHAARQTAQGMVPYINVIECTHLIHPANLGTAQDSWAPSFSPNHMEVLNAPAALRPSDVMISLAAAAKSAQMGETIIESRTAVDLMKSNRANALPSEYMHKTLNAMRYGFEAAGENPMSDPSAAYEHGGGIIAEKTPFTDRFLNPMITDLGMRQRGFITWQQLVSIHPEIHNENVTRVTVRDTGQSDHYQAVAGDYDSLVGNQLMETNVFHRIMNTVPGLMLNSLIVSARIHVTNMTVNGQMSCMITDPLSFADVPAAYILERIEYIQTRFVNVAFKDIGLPPHMPFDAYFTIDAFGESFASISVNGGVHIPYTSASYADGRSTQIVSANGDVLPRISNDLKYLATNLF